MSTSQEIPYNYSPYWIAYKLSESCYGLYNKVEGLKCEQDDGYEYYYENGICFKLRFKGINSKMGEFNIISA